MRGWRQEKDFHPHPEPSPLKGEGIEDRTSIKGEAVRILYQSEGWCLEILAPKDEGE